MFPISRFHEILKHLPRPVFERLVKKHRSDKYCKGFGSWSQLVVMLYGQLGGASSLRTLETGFNSQYPYYHPGVRALRRSTLRYANAQRNPVVFAEALELLMTQLRRNIRRQVKEALSLLDSSSLTLKGRGFDAWTLSNRTRNTQGVKLHLLFEVHTALWHYGGQCESPLPVAGPFSPQYGGAFGSINDCLANFAIYSEVSEMRGQ
ncbi:MAG: DUF4372 domain-containing protein [Betaproteobacteria bacterium]|nr:DUF4372 domain-containing protein [Betaproteobacteria bacterium]